MGFNTVVFLLNDFMHTLKDSPKSLAYLLGHPPMSEREKNHDYEHKYVSDGEKPIHGQAVEVLPTFHADEQKFFLAGGNCIRELKLVRLGVTKEGKKTVTLELPEYFEPRWYTAKPKNWPKRKP